MLLIEDPTVTVKCTTTIKALSVLLDNLSCSLHQYYFLLIYEAFKDYFPRIPDLI
jgi:hypothetical protein